MTKLYLIRHGETEENRNSRFCGWKNVSLNQKGRLQAEKLGQLLKNTTIDIIYTSGLKRTKETAEYIKINHEVPIYATEDLKELNFGKVEGLTLQEIKIHYPEVFRGLEKDYIKLRFPEGESLEEMHGRVTNAVDRIIQNNLGNNIVLVAHSGVIRSIIAHLITGDIKHHWNFKIDHCSITVLEIHENFAVLTKLNDSCHLKDRVQVKEGNKDEA
ncbi:alpha-ribazole phosphatase [Natronincola peptidivorans]|uniref:phosphoglycerate mutase (2,3-diphosphoglycerate-dependent) n=1 Tax=Natronincola peptidivorans TaxID=426128 RepID=A0A1I0DL80_9FIRM|nr:histidine phosphatase family protein [Natronincola peptidivorans]SET32591.1 alpha-ribazole phosphatase [Natronincola peptidivorans]